MKPIKKKKCAICRELFEPFRTTQKCCTTGCAIQQAQKVRATKEAKEYREEKERIKSRQDWLKEVQQAFNSWVRARDDGLPCISCGSFTGKKNCGHYRSVGSCPELRFEPLNTALQCEKCNSYLSGNLINYRIELIKRIGVETVEWIEGKHEPKKYTIPELKELKALYKRKLKELNKE